VVGHNLHRLGDVAIPEGGPQIRVPVQHGGGAAAQQFDVNRAVDVHPQLHGVEVDAVGACCAGGAVGSQSI
jgi:hypothetical protein